jgi:ubiquinone/menaquinone biosynthesis C-methylase UbiE
MQFHDFPVESFDGALICDLGCGRSDIERDLASLGIKATVLGFDIHKWALQEQFLQDAPSIGPKTKRIHASLDNLPLPDGVADFTIATYSYPMMAETVQEIDDFYAEAMRITAIGNGILSIYPIYASIIRGVAEDKEARSNAAHAGARAIRQSPNWLNVCSDYEALTARRLA